MVTTRPLAPVELKGLPGAMRLHAAHGPAEAVAFKPTGAPLGEDTADESQGGSVRLMVVLLVHHE